MSYNRRGILKTGLYDVNDDGVMEFCFVRSRFDDPVQLLGAYCVREGKFDPVIYEEYRDLYYSIEFEKTILPNGLELQPLLKGEYVWQIYKLYELPIRLTNRSQKAIDLKGCYLGLNQRFSGTTQYKTFEVDSLAPGDSMETLITVSFYERIPKTKFSIELIGLQK